jgi:Uri superfamily endonuclease
VKRGAKGAVEAFVARLPDSGVYQVMFVLDEPVRLAVGALGTLSFAAGCWVYTGSAKRWLRRRVARHLSREKKRRWHIDYLLGPGRPVAVRVFEGGAGECETHGRLASRFAEGPRGFGSSDCRCGSHLCHLGEKHLDLRGFLPILQSGQI